MTSTLDHPAGARGGSPQAAGDSLLAGRDAPAAGPDAPVAGTAAAPPARVVAVVVLDATDGAGPSAMRSTLAAVAAQTRRVDHVVVAADSARAAASAQDADDARRRDGLGALDVVVAAGGGFADLVRCAVASLDEGALAPGPVTGDAAVAGVGWGPGAAAGPGAADSAPGGDGAPPPPVWLWLLPAGCLPASQALEKLLAVTTAPAVAVAGCKQRRAGSRELLGVGLSASTAGRPITGIDPGEVDQGQLDHRDDVLAVAVPGTLVRRDVWDRVGGVDPLLHGRGGTTALDLGRRVHRAGHRVVVVPAAVVALPEPRAAAAAPGRPGRGPVATGPDVPAGRRDLVHLRLTGCSPAALPLVVLQVLLGCAVRVLARLADGHGRAAGREVAAVTAVLARPDRVWRARRRLARTARRPRRELRPLLVDRREVMRWHRDRRHWRRESTAVRRAGTGTTHPAGRAGAAVLGMLLLVLAGCAAVVLREPLLAVASGSALTAVGGPAALPAAGSTLWAAATSDWLPDGLGVQGVPDPLLAVLSALALPLAGRPDLLVAALLLAAVPLAGLSGWVGAGALTRSPWLRLLAAAGWAGAPVLLLAVDGGRVGAVLAHLALPPAARALAVAVAPGGRRPWAAAAAGSLLLVPASAGAPLLLPAVGLALVAAVAAGGRGWLRRLPLLLVPLPPLAVLAPLLADPAASLWSLLVSPGPAAATAPAPGWLLLLGWPVPAAAGTSSPLGLAVTASLVAGALLLVPALLALGRGGRDGAAVRAGWALLALGLLTAVTAALAAAREGAPLGVWPGAGGSLALLGVLAAVLAGVGRGDRPGGDGRDRRDPLRRRLLVAAVVALAAAPLTGLGAWALARTAGPGGLAGGAGLQAAPALPAVAADAAGGPLRTRTLVLSQRGGAVSWALADTASPSATAAAASRPQRPAVAAAAQDAADAAVARAVAALASSRVDAAPLLTDLGVGYVLVRGEVPDATSDDGSAAVEVRLDDATLDAAPGLARAGETGEDRLWRVGSGEPVTTAAAGARARLLSADGDTAGEVPVAADAGAPLRVAHALAAGEAGRLLVLAERSDPGWRAWLDGRPLTPAVHAGWAQAFELPADGGRLVVQRAETLPGWVTPARVGVLALAVLLALALPGYRGVRP